MATKTKLSDRELDRAFAFLRRTVKGMERCLRMIRLTAAFTETLPTARRLSPRRRG